MLQILSPESLRARRSEKWATYPADILPAFIAEMDFAPPAAVTDALSAAIKIADFGYAYPGELADAFAHFAAAHFGWKVDVDRVFAAPDVMSAIEQALKLNTEPGDGVVVNPPVYPPFFEVVRAAGRTIVEVPLIRSEDRWNLDLDAMERAFSSGARAYILCSPHNPVGRVWRREELRAIATLAEENCITVIVDEIHAPLTLDGTPHTPYLSLATDCDRAFAAYSASKTWNIAGLKCALAVAGSQSGATALAKHWKLQPSETTWRVGHLGVVASIAAFREGRPWLQAVQAYLRNNRKDLRALLDEHIPAVKYIEPQASYLAWLDCSELRIGDNPARFFLERGRVALSSGRDFGKEGADFVRLNMGTSATMLAEIVARMGAAVRRLA